MSERIRLCKECAYWSEFGGCTLGRATRGGWEVACPRFRRPWREDDWTLPHEAPRPRHTEAKQ